MSYNLFLDDERVPSDVKWVVLPEYEWEIARSYNDFVIMIKEKGVPDCITFDHDLADAHYKGLFDDPITHVTQYDSFSEKTGYHCAKWLVEWCSGEKVKLPNEIYVHTRNPIGRDKIISIINQGKKYLNI